MDIGEEEVVSMPISTTSFAAANDSSKLRMLASSAACPDDPDDVPPHGRRKDKRDRAAAAAAAAAAERDREQRLVRYRECLKNHAASMGGHVTDGCGEFMPAGDDGTPESLRCAACDCHRNFHRREVDGDDEVACDACFHRRASGIVAAAAPAAAAPPGSLIPAPALPFAARPPQVLAFRAAGDEHGEGMAGFPSLGGAGVGIGMGGTLSSVGVKKRFRTKFTTEQKERMLAFAQRVGWRIQKHDETAVQHFCQEVGVKRHVLKVWMHNNKHAFTRPSAASSHSHSHSHSHFQQQHPPASASDHHASAVAAAAAAALDSSNNNTNHINDHTGTTATNSSSNNDSTHSERDFQ